MINCHEMKKGQIYVCEECGLELQVIQECKECGTPADSCKHEECRFVCCDNSLKLKK
jgi:hypothetical protein